MDPVILPRWARLLPIIAIAILALGGSAVLTPVSDAATSPPAARWVPADDGNGTHVVRQTADLPSGAVGSRSIPTIGVDAVARPVGLLPSGNMDVTPNIWDVGVFNQTVQPGQPGSAVIEGHLDWYTGPAVFWNLHRLGPGDEIDYTGADGTVHRFLVSRARNIPYTSAIPDDLYATGGPPTITLITCSGTWLRGAHSYSTRLLLTATAAP
jgi:sortase (surface protein transpeptidase)